MMRFRYSRRIYYMIGDIISHARMSRNKSKELAFEKKKTELLLYEVTFEGSISFNMHVTMWLA